MRCGNRLKFHSPIVADQVIMHRFWVSTYAMHYSHFNCISNSVPGGRPGGTAPVAETGAVPAP